VCKSHRTGNKKNHKKYEKINLYKNKIWSDESSSLGGEIRNTYEILVEKPLGIYYLETQT
jgi:hypothetical protein